MAATDKKLFLEIFKRMAVWAEERAQTIYWGTEVPAERLVAQFTAAWKAPGGVIAAAAIPDREEAVYSVLAAPALIAGMKTVFGGAVMAVAVAAAMGGAVTIPLADREVPALSWWSGKTTLISY